MPVTTIHRRATRTLAVAALAITATACPVDPPVTPPTGPSPTRATVTTVTPGGSSFSSRPMSADGRYVAYGRYVPLGFEPGGILRLVPYLWDRVGGTSVQLAELNEFGPMPTPPIVSSDGSTVYLAASQVDPEPAPNNDGRALVRYDTESGDLDEFDVPTDAPFGHRRVTEVATSADGSTAAVELSEGGAFFLSDVAVWTEAGGYELITDRSSPSAAGVYGYDLPGAGISENGRHVAVTTLFNDGGGARHSRLDVYDRTDDSWRTAWTGATTTDPNLYFETVRVQATLDDGSVIFDVTTSGASNQFMQSQGVRMWNATTSSLSQLVPGDTAAQVWSASPDGRFVGYTGSDRGSTPSNFAFGTPHVLDRQSGTILPAGSRTFTLPIAVATDAASVLLFSNDATLTDPAGPGTDLLLWDRS